MSLMHRQTTEPMIEANRANALQSSGPRTAAGKVATRRNALKHGARAQGDPVIPELDECKEDLDLLRVEFWRDLQPCGQLEAALVEQIVDNRWRYRRILRAESSLLVAQRLEFDFGRTQARAGESRSSSSAGEAALAKEMGLASLPDSTAKFRFILQCLRGAQQAVEAEGFVQGGLKRLEAVYGPNPGLAGAALLATYHECQKAALAPGAPLTPERALPLSPAPLPAAALAPGSPSAPEQALPQPPAPFPTMALAHASSPEEEFRARRAEFLALLGVEIRSFQKLQKLHLASSRQLTDAVRDTLQILPVDELNRIMRYEDFLDRQYDRLLKQLARRQAARLKVRSGRGDR
jgi:hypothetical protein